MKNLAVARRYAKALLQIGKDDGQLDSYRGELRAVADLVAREKALDQALTNPLYDLEDRRKVLLTVIEKLGLSRVMSSFLQLLFDKRRMGFIGPINEFYQHMADELQGLARAHLTAATELSSEAVEKIRAALSQRTGKDIVLEVEQDPQLIGGIVTRIGDLVLDGSIRTQLANMRESLKRGEIA
jgi:F-type H+-transporting ATPase subunit delta